MELDSARELKDSLRERLVPVLRSQARESAAVSARRLEGVGPYFRNVALGITAAERGKAKLAVRVQDRNFETGPLIDEIERAAANEVDVRYVGRVRKRVAPWHQTRVRPVVIGASCGHFSVTAGTIGFFATSRTGVGIVSNNHVLADENRARPGDAILQPGSWDGGGLDDAIARLGQFIPLSNVDPNRVDCAFGDLLPDVLHDSSSLTEALGPGEVAELQGTTNVADLEGEGTYRVEKLGRTTGHTLGRISAIEVDDLVVSYDTGTLLFEGQIEIAGIDAPFSQGGDSGSLIYTTDSRRVVGLLFAGSDQGGDGSLGLTFANPISDVTDSLDVTILT